MVLYPSQENAIHELAPNQTWELIDFDLDQLNWDSGNSITKPSKSAIEAKQAELKTAWDAAQYQRDRVNLKNTVRYPEITDQLDMIYHDQVNGTTTFKDAIKAVKDAHPKPS